RPRVLDQGIGTRRRVLHRDERAQRLQQELRGSLSHERKRAGALSAVCDGAELSERPRNGSADRRKRSATQRGEAQLRQHGLEPPPLASLVPRTRAKALV